MCAAARVAEKLNAEKVKDEQEKVEGEGKSGNEGLRDFSLCKCFFFNLTHCP